MSLAKLEEYVRVNWARLPKSSFDDYEVVLIKEIDNHDGGWGHHNYEGYGLDAQGRLMWCYSSGCSCDSHCGCDHIPSNKVFQIQAETPDLFDGIEGWNLPEPVTFGN